MMHFSLNIGKDHGGKFDNIKFTNVDEFLIFFFNINLNFPKIFIRIKRGNVEDEIGKFTAKKCHLNKMT